MVERSSFHGILRALRDLGWTPGAIIDIGVGHGTPGLYTTWPGVPTCLVEPSPQAGQFIDEIARRFENVKAYKVGASNRAGSMTVKVDPTGYFVQFGPHKHKWREIEVPVMTCDQIVADAGLAGPFLYKLDTDAHEVEILQGSLQTLEAAEVCIIEFNFLYPVLGMPGPNDIWRILADNGFTLFDISALSYSGAGVARGADICFVKQDSDLLNKLAWANAAKGKRREPLKTIEV